MGNVVVLDPAAIEVADPDRSELVDAFGDITELRKAFAPTEAKYKKLFDELKLRYENKGALREFTEKGTRWQVDISMRGNETVVDKRAAYKKLGLRKFLKAVSITLKALGEFLTTPEIGELTTIEQTGHRKFTSTPLLPDNVALGPNPVPVEIAA